MNTSDSYGYENNAQNFNLQKSYARTNVKILTRNETEK